MTLNWVHSLGDTLEIHFKTVEIALVDDHSLFVDGLTQLIALMDERFRVRGFTDGNEFLLSVDSGYRPNLVLCDLTMKSLNGLAVVSRLKSVTPDIPIYIMSAVENDQIKEAARTVGVSGFLSKAISARDLEIEIRDAVNRPPAQARKDQLTGEYTFTPRQIEILKLISAGQTTKSTSEKLGISENTVKTHLRQIFIQFNVTRRTECIEKARILGLV